MLTRPKALARCIALTWLISVDLIAGLQRFHAAKAYDRACGEHLVFDVGLWKTGTTSVSNFIGQMGYIEEYGAMGEIRTLNPISDVDLLEFLRKGPKSRKSNPYMKLFAGEHVVYSTDLYIQVAACELSRAYPEAAFVLTTRNFDHAMFEAFKETWCCPDCIPCDDRQPGMVSALKSAQCGQRCDMLVPIIEELCIDGEKPICDNPGMWEQVRPAIEAYYYAHEKLVRACVPPERLLELPIDAESDEAKAHSLRKFLNCPAGNSSFPHSNEREHV